MSHIDTIALLNIVDDNIWKYNWGYNVYDQNIQRQISFKKELNEPFPKSGPRIDR